MSFFNKIIEQKLIKRQYGLTNDQSSNLKKQRIRKLLVQETI